MQPHPPDLVVKPRTLLPLMLLPREHLSLSCLDLASPHGEFMRGRFFESRIRIMELEGRLGSNVLIARSDSHHNVFALERDHSGFYVLCKLGAWVDLESLSVNATAVCAQRIRPSSTLKQHLVFEPPLITPQQHHESKRKREAINELQSRIKKRQKTQSDAGVVDIFSQSPALSGSLPISVEESGISQPSTQPAQQQSVDTLLSTDVDAAMDLAGACVDVPPEQQTADAMFENIRTQYFEALYHSMVRTSYP